MFFFSIKDTCDGHSRAETAKVFMHLIRKQNQTGGPVQRNLNTPCLTRNFSRWQRYKKPGTPAAAGGRGSQGHRAWSRPCPVRCAGDEDPVWQFTGPGRCRPCVTAALSAVRRPPRGPRCPFQLHLENRSSNNMLKIKTVRQIHHGSHTQERGRESK